MVSFSVASMFFHEYTVSDIFLYVSRTGLNAMEFWLETPHFWLRDLPVDEVIACRNKHPGITTLTVHSPILDLNPCSINPDVARISVDYAVRSLGIAGQLGAHILTVHPGRRTAKRPPSDADFVRFDHYVAALREAATRTSIKIGMENMEPVVNSLLCTPERMRVLLDEEPWLFFTLDVAHAMAKSEDEVIRYIELCHDRLINVHISRFDRGKAHFPLDRSASMEKVMESLKDHHYNGSLTLEIEDLNLDRSLSAEEKVALLARDCVFMQECME
ncbi:MAG: sugar phosphate isomerase/epimerase [Methanoregula sp.]|jgi:sugar phosphate isomerase/epimerase|nr:sugar phosphate isomerase/epimerase [Methanoregula sp.]